VTIGAGHGTTSLKVKFFNDDPGVPSELTTDHVRILMLSDGGNTILSQAFFPERLNGAARMRQSHRRLRRNHTPSTKPD